MLPLTMMHHNHEMKSYTYLWQRLAWCSVYTEDNSTEQQLHFLSLLSFPFPPFDSLIFFLFCALDFLIHPSHKGQRRGSEELRTLPISVKVQKGQTNYLSSNLENNCWQRWALRMIKSNLHVLPEAWHTHHYNILLQDNVYQHWTISDRLKLNNLNYQLTRGTGEAYYIRLLTNT